MAKKLEDCLGPNEEAVHEQRVGPSNRSLVGKEPLTAS